MIFIVMEKAAGGVEAFYIYITPQYIRDLLYEIKSLMVLGWRILHFYNYTYA